MDYCGKTTKSGSVFSTWYGAIDEFGAREGDYNQKTGLYSTHPITASGDEFNAKLLTAASNVVPLGSYITLNANGKDMTVLINDRIGAPAPDTCVDLSSGAFYKITGDLCSSRLKIDSGTVSATKPDDYVTGDMVDFHNMKLTECAP
jgi:hypothetical protein